MNSTKTIQEIQEDEMIRNEMNEFDENEYAQIWAYGAQAVMRAYIEAAGLDAVIDHLRPKPILRDLGVPEVILDRIISRDLIEMIMDLDELLIWHVGRLELGQSSDTEIPLEWAQRVLDILRAEEVEA